MNRSFEIIPHTADVTLRIYGTTQADVFSNALVSMFESMEPLWNKQSPRMQRTIAVKGPDREALLVAFLSEALYSGAVHHEAYHAVHILTCSDYECSAHLEGQSIAGYAGPEIKAVTYHDLSIISQPTGWQATITFDI